MKRLLTNVLVVIGILFFTNILLISKVEAKPKDILNKLFKKKITKFCLTEGTTSWMRGFIFPLEDGKPCSGKIINKFDRKFETILKLYAKNTVKYGDVLTLSQSQYYIIS